MRVSRISSKKDLEKAFAIRIRVFVAEQRVPQEIEMDRDDKRALHFLAIEAGKAVGTTRVVMRRAHGGAENPSWAGRWDEATETRHQNGEKTGCAKNLSSRASSRDWFL